MELQNQPDQNEIDQNQNDLTIEFTQNPTNFFSGLSNQPNRLTKIQRKQEIKAQKLMSKVKKETKKKSSKAIAKKTFQQLGLVRNLVKACDDQNFQEPTFIQELAIPIILSGKDVLASSVTGSGKTAAFILPIIQKYQSQQKQYSNYCKSLVIIPTREVKNNNSNKNCLQLAIQCYEMTQRLNKYSQIQVCLIIGKTSLEKQEADLRRNPDLVIATPGRLIDIIKNSKVYTIIYLFFSKGIDFNQLEIIVFDEADKLLEMGFQSEIKELAQSLPFQCQKLLFSATLGANILDLAKISLNKPVRLRADPERATSKQLRQEIIELPESDSKDNRRAMLFYICSRVYKENCVIFFRTKRECNRMGHLMKLLGMNVCQLHGDIYQEQRIKHFQDFRNGKYSFLLATDLAARGLDILQIEKVINFELPLEQNRYIHRVGRTARAGNQGIALTICDEQEIKRLKNWLKEMKDKLYKKKINELYLKKCEQTIEKKKGQLQQVLEEEKAEQELQFAEIQAKKAENMIKFKKEILNRPKREWIPKIKKPIQKKGAGKIDNKKFNNRKGNDNRKSNNNFHNNNRKDNNNNRKPNNNNRRPSTNIRKPNNNNRKPNNSNRKPNNNNNNRKFNMKK